MTRPKVPPELRQRTSQACDSCKRRKQKCNGENPCNTCKRRSFHCAYTTPSNHHAPHAERAARKRALELAASRPVQSIAPLPNGPELSPPDVKRDQPFLFAAADPKSPLVKTDMQSSPSNGMSASTPNPVSPAPPPATIPDESMQTAARNLQQFSSLPRTRSTAEDRTKSFLSIVTGLSGHEGEALVHTGTRMLQDHKGRLLYIGDSATLSFLAVLRMSVDSLVGRCAFVDDPRRHMITEPVVHQYDSRKVSILLPDKATCYVMVDSFFFNTQGVLNLFDRERFMTALEEMFKNPMAADDSWMCTLNLVLAIGLALVTTTPGTHSHVLIEKVRHDRDDAADHFYRTARSWVDPVEQIEDADLWSIQTLLLMAFYMLVKSKRSAACAYLDMAIRSGYNIGLHVEDTTSPVIFGDSESAARRHLWRSLFVLDRFLAVALGRPPAIVEDEIYPSAGRHNSITSEMYNQNRVPPFQEHADEAMDAAVKVSSLIGMILRKIYRQRKIGTRVAQQLSFHMKAWPSGIASALQWPNKATYPHSAQSPAILHINLLYTHAAILLCRPFFIYNFNHEIMRITNPDRASPPRRGLSKIAGFSHACVSAATHAVSLVREGFDAGILPRRDPLAVYFLSSAGLVLIANDCLHLHNHKLAEKSIQDTLKIMKYCSVEDEQAERLLYVMETFIEASSMHKAKRAKTGDHSNQLAPLMPPPSSGTQDTLSLPPRTSAFGPQSLPSFAPPFSSGPPPNPFAPSSQPFAQPSPVLSSGFVGSAAGKSTSSTPTPMEPLPPLSAPPNPLSPAPNRTALPSPGHIMSFDQPTAMTFTSMLDFPFSQGDLGLDDPSGGEENIEFDQFWNWQNGASGINGNLGMASGPVQMIGSENNGQHQMYEPMSTSMEG